MKKYKIIIDGLYVDEIQDLNQMLTIDEEKIE
jgi:hypothetical protein